MLEMPDISRYTREITDSILQHWRQTKIGLLGGVRFGVLSTSHFGAQLGLDNGNGNGNGNNGGNGNCNWPLLFKIYDISNAGP